MGENGTVILIEQRQKILTLKSTSARQPFAHLYAN